MTLISKRIKEIRIMHRLTQTEFGELFGVKKSTVCSWEKGKSSSEDKIKIKMCKIFSISLDWLFGITD